MTSAVYPERPPEFPLPAHGMPDDVRKRLHPWIAGFIGLTTAEANERLKKRWASIERQSLKDLRETLGTFNVKSIIDYDDGGMIYAVRSGSDGSSIGDSFYLPAPLEPSEIRKHLEPSGTDGNQALREFLYYFAGLAEDPPAAGHFAYWEPPWPLFTDNVTGDLAIESLDEWKNALMLYHARNGCFILVRPDGKVAWWVFQEALITPVADHFDDFVLKFNEHRKSSYPYDPYGAPDDEN